MTQHDEVDYVSGRTRLYGIIGDPIVQVRSPEMVTAELKRQGADAVLVPLHVRPADFATALAGLKALANLDGLIFTIPYKAQAMALADALEPQGERVGAINALARRRDGSWIGDMFDGVGCVEAFRRRGLGFAGKRVAQIGAGGAGSAVAIAIAQERPASLRLHDIDAARLAALTAKVRAIDPAIAVETGAPALEATDILLNVSPVGMLEDARLPIAATSLPPRLIVFDAIVKPEQTPLLALAEASGCTAIPGREMMRGQIARMVAFFLGETG